MDRSLAELNRTVEIDADCAPAYNILGYTYMERGDYEEAEAAFQNYMRLLPREPNPHDSMADLYTKMGRHEEARQAMQGRTGAR